MYETAKRILLIDLPSLDTFLKIPITVVALAILSFLLVALWRDPLRASVLDSAAAARLEKGTQAFFDGYQGVAVAAPAIVFGAAKDIVRRMSSDKDVFQHVDTEIEVMKKTDANWTYANQKAAGKALVNSLGLEPETTTDNKIFLQMALPASTKEPAANGTPAPSPKPDVSGARP
jgi:hypothetical protein